MNLTEAEIAEEVRRIKTEENWPLWPILPVKNIHRNEPGYEGEGLGIVTAGRSDVPFTIHLINLLQLKKGKLAPQLEGVPTLEFPRGEDAVREGWVGD